MHPGVYLAWLYCRYAPFSRGKQRLKRFAVNMLPGKNLVVSSRFDTRFELSFPLDTGWEDLVFLRSFETGTTDLVRKLLQPTDVVFDIGANIGWYTTFVARNVSQGMCHSFEPMKSVFHELEQNCRLNGVIDRVRLNMVALGKTQGSLQLHTFAGLPHSHNSINSLGRPDASPCTVPVDTLNNYVSTHTIEKVDLIKIDVEGAEMMVLQGADAVFDMTPPPSWILEMNETTANASGYKPRDLLAFVTSRTPCTFIRIRKAWGKPAVMGSIDDIEDGDNVLCVPYARQDTRIVLEHIV